MRAFPVLALSWLLGGCALQFTDAAGVRHFVGMMHLALPSAERPPAGADWFRMRSIGFMATHGAYGGVLGVGYNDTAVAVIRNNSCIALYEGAPYAAIFQSYPGDPGLRVTDRVRGH